MSMGNLWGSLFFIFMTFAALTTVLAVFETILACCMDLFRLEPGRRPASSTAC